MRGAERDRPFDFRGDYGFGPVLDAKLHQLDAEGQKAGEPIRIGKDRIEGIEANQGRVR